MCLIHLSFEEIYFCYTPRGLTGPNRGRNKPISKIKTYTFSIEVSQLTRCASLLNGKLLEFVAFSLFF